MRRRLVYRDDGVEVVVTFTSDDPAVRLASLQGAYDRMGTWRRLGVRWARDRKDLTFAEIAAALGISRPGALKLWQTSGPAGERVMTLPLE